MAGLRMLLDPGKTGAEALTLEANLKKRVVGQDHAVREIVENGGHVIEVDMTEAQSNILTKVQAAESIYGRIDILVNNAGYSILGGIEQFRHV